MRNMCTISFFWLIATENIQNFFKVTIRCRAVVASYVRYNQIFKKLYGVFPIAFIDRFATTFVIYFLFL